MTGTTTPTQARPKGKGKGKAKTEVVKTWAFDSAGPRKYAVQIQRAANGNPFLKFVEGVPQDDGTFRKFSLIVWSEDFDLLFEKLDEVRSYLQQHGITTPKGHKYDPNKWKNKRRSRRN